MKDYVTGAAGFIGSLLSSRLLARGGSVVGLDNISDYYDPDLKLARLKHFCDHNNFRHARIDNQ